MEFLITGDENVEYEEYFTKKHFSGNETLKMLSIGSGTCSHELKLAELKPNWEIECYDFSNLLMEQTKKTAQEKQLQNIHFFSENVLTQPFEENHYDIVFFHASLHHFDKIDSFLKSVVIKTLKMGGYLVVNEFVGNDRLQFSKEQICTINKAIQAIPKKYRKIYKANFYKKKFYGSGVLRMIAADPSECVDSSSILPAIYKYFDTVEEKFYGNNIIMSALKDIAHHFAVEDDEKTAILKKVFEIEDCFLQNHPSDFVFGIYRLKNGKVS